MMIDPKLPSCLYGDEVRIRQIINNFLSNAVKYTKEGSIALSISCESLSEDQIVLKIAVKDTGIGIREEDMDKLFDSFARLEEKRNRSIEGTGLGLNLTKILRNGINSFLLLQNFKDSLLLHRMHRFLLWMMLRSI